MVAAKDDRSGDDGDAWAKLKLRLGVPLHIVLEIPMDVCGGGSGASWHWFGSSLGVVVVVGGRSLTVVLGWSVQHWLMNCPLEEAA